MNPADDDYAFLLGAGASAEAGLPMAPELTGAAIDELNSSNSELAGILNYVVGAMVAHDTRNGARPDILPGIERVVSAVELLSKRDELEVTPFVRAWNPDAAGGSSRWHKDSAFGRDIKRQILSEHFDNRVAESIRRLILDETGSAGSGHIYHTLWETLLRMLPIQLTLSEHVGVVEYLAPLGRIARKRGALLVGTMNYDLSVESACATTGTTVVRGIDGWLESGSLNFSGQGVHLVKLHGSIDWIRAPYDFRQRSPHQLRLPQDLIKIGIAHHRELPLVVYGQREKLRPFGPFLDLRAGFAKMTRTAGILFVVGYSFGDDHVNELIRDWVNTDDHRLLVVVNPYLNAKDRYPAGSLLVDIQRNLVPDRFSVDRGEQDARSRAIVLRRPASWLLKRLDVAEAETLALIRRLEHFNAGP